MPVTTLNKIIHLLLTGTLVLMALAGVLLVQGVIPSIPPLSASAYLSSPAVVFLATLLIVPVVLLIGLITDGLTHILVRRHTEAVMKHPWVLAITFTAFDYEQYLAHDRTIQPLLDSELDSETMVETPAARGRLRRSFATGIFLKTANKDAIDWAIQHYSMYLFATSGVLVVFAILLWAPFATRLAWPARTALIAGDALALWVLAHSSIEKYLYTYEVTYRHAILVLKEGSRVAKEQLSSAAGQTG